MIKRKPYHFVRNVDDSGSEGLGPVFVLAGYVAPAETWQRFSIDWRAIMDEHPTISHFKMKEANSFRGEFFGWQVEEQSVTTSYAVQNVTEPEIWSVYP